MMKSHLMYPGGICHCPQTQPWSSSDLKLVLVLELFFPTYSLVSPQISAFNKAGSSSNSSEIIIPAAEPRPQRRLLIWTRQYVAKLDYDLKVRICICNEYFTKEKHAYYHGTSRLQRYHNNRLNCRNAAVMMLRKNCDANCGIRSKTKRLHP